MMKKPSAFQAWELLVLSLPKGIAAFVVIVAGLSISLPLSVFLIGIPLLAFTLVLCRSIMVGEGSNVTAWLQGQKRSAANDQPKAAATEQQSWRSWLASVMKDGKSYRSILFGIVQLPISIVMFTLAIVLPATAFAVLLSPAAYEVSMRLFEFDLFSTEWGLDQLFDWNLTSAQRSWIAGGVGLVFSLLIPPLLKGLGRWYSAWILSVAGPEPVREVKQEVAYNREMFEYLMALGEEGHPANETDKNLARA
ncbi:sensor domain-containing protein [Paenibacillus soyae]|uniref:Sensor domain-containing protein n=1 Tax=Paenibacillus soyae TaxID=2969249 RepID=A0A9X2S9Y5_9BACL|nr:sensor domain-containing protein [Paenibacillus soyae]MCR2805565.1 sensor domain-containing protein [Paenibacillus soyae]